eukprot:TRINITY_DN10468_c0_g1_i1.p1 TRINITY_DN10468_c0_g1~~TRINITY_DN10468_c0_g1_i1.p1  ORF type:complete len:890 (+),score=136.93 TRINITY_DN10468_c0_g1_i1:86-2755(+)
MSLDMKGVQSLLGYSGSCLILVNAIVHPNYLIQLPHLFVGLILGSRRLPLIFSSLLLFYLGIYAIAVPRPELVIWAWRVFQPAALFLGLVGFCAALGRKLGGAVFVVIIACVTRWFLIYSPTFIAEDTLEHYDNLAATIETPELHDELCRKRPDEAAQLGVLCSPLELLSWHEAEQKASEMLQKMTSWERHSLMKGIGWIDVPSWLKSPLPALPKRGYYMGNTPPIPRLGVPPLKLHDAGNGFRNMPEPQGKQGTTIMWPCSLAFGATWDDHLVQEVSAAIGREYRGKGSNVILGPSVQVQRVARNGRNFEYMSGEDPYLGSRLATAYVTGVQSEGVMACLKHYGFNEQETNRHTGNSIVDERTAWELYYPPFQAGVDAGAGSVMCSYNRVNGTYACANEELLVRDLKQKMNFRGFVMTDWWALHHGPNASVVRGLDMEMPGAGSSPEGAATFLHHEDLEALEQAGGGDFKGYLGQGHSGSIYSDAAFRILAATHKLRLFERPSCTPGSDCVGAIESQQRSARSDELARRAATESVILLQNRDKLLPIRKTAGKKTIALIGLTWTARSYSSAELGMHGDYYSGGGSGHCYMPLENLSTPYDRVRDQAQRLGIEIISSFSNDPAEAVAVARQADVAIVLTATSAMESVDRETLHLDFEADDLIAAVAKIQSQTVVLVQAPGTVLMPWRGDVGAIALMFLGGEHTGAAWASIVFGDVSPSGKLPIMIPISPADVIEPGQDLDVNYTEGLFTSYRARDASNRSAFPFGHGLSYTEFTSGTPFVLFATRAQEEGCKFVCVESTVTNVGSESGAEVLQVYVEFPPEAEEPKLLLRGFQKTAVLKPGEGEVVKFNFTERDFSVYRGKWEMQRNLKLHIGSSSRDLHYSIPLEVQM